MPTGAPRATRSAIGSGARGRRPGPSDGPRGAGGDVTISMGQRVSVAARRRDAEGHRGTAGDALGPDAARPRLLGNTITDFVRAALRVAQGSNKSTQPSVPKGQAPTTIGPEGTGSRNHRSRRDGLPQPPVPKGRAPTTIGPEGTGSHNHRPRRDGLPQPSVPKGPRPPPAPMAIGPSRASEEPASLRSGRVNTAPRPLWPAQTDLYLPGGRRPEEHRQTCNFNILERLDMAMGTSLRGG
jgi:hypothetical protein